ncbi:MAG TPA: NAD(P)-dependent oxidoreductase [Steroidobacteraceae bacterium]|nr:NAD(P)-dependent oxidoreductase [Steroidobacteraceae bacterium]
MKTGFIGLGAMGAHMARNLHRAGLLAGVWNRGRERAQAFAAETGCALAADPAALAHSVEVIVMCVSADADVLGIVDALLPGARAGLVVIDCSTVAAATARDAAGRLARAGADFLDCPVSGGVEGARDATLAIMCGGTAEAFARARPVLEKMGRTVVHIGPTGFGQATKATNQIMCAGIIQAVAEAMAFAKAEGLPLDKVIDTLGKGAGSSWYFVNRAPFMARGSFPPGFRIKLHDKDLRICRDMAVRYGVHLPVIETTLAQYALLIESGHGDEDISSIFRLKDALFTSGGTPR